MWGGTQRIWTEQLLKRGCLRPLSRVPRFLVQGPRRIRTEQLLRYGKNSDHRVCRVCVEFCDGLNVGLVRARLAFSWFMLPMGVGRDLPHRIASHRPSHRHRIVRRIVTASSVASSSHRKISTSLQLVPEVVDPLRHSGVHGRKASAICTNCSASIERRQSWQIPWSFVTPFSFCLWLWANRL